MRRVSLIVLLICLAGRVEAGDGLKLRLELDRDRYAPGEFLTCSVSAVNSGPGTPKIEKPSTGGALSRVDVRLVSPSGKEYRHPRSRAGGLDVPVPSGRPVLLHVFLLRLSTDHLGFSPAAPPLWRAGTWKIRVLRPGSNGALTTNTVAFKVRPVTTRRKHPTAEQREALERVRKSYPAYDRKDVDLLRAALLRTENEGLANHLLDAVIKGRPGDGTGLLPMLARRASSRPHHWRGEHHAGIDGSYLSRFADLVLDAWEMKPEAARLNDFRRPSYLNAVVAWVKLHPEDKKRRKRLEAMARKAAKIRMLDEPDPARRGRRWESDGPFGPEYAWSFLIDLGVLHGGMTIDEAEKILGKCRKRGGPAGRPCWISWYLDSPRHVNPCLNAEVKDGKIVKFRRTNA